MGEIPDRGSSHAREIDEDEIVVGWTRIAAPGLHGRFGATRLQEVVRHKSDAERAMENFFKAAEAASADEESLDRLDKALATFRQALATCRENELALTPPAPPELNQDSGHLGRMDAARALITAVLVVGVLVVVGWALAGGQAGSAAQVAAPVSGLAGIGMGWLFTTQSSRPPDDN